MIGIIEVDDLGKYVIIRKDGRNYRVSFKVLKKHEVSFFVGWGWLTHDELWDLRQTAPRIAP